MAVIKNNNKSKSKAKADLRSSRTKTNPRLDKAKAGPHLNNQLRSKTAQARRKHASWRRDLGIGYAVYDHEEDYVSPVADEDLDAAQINLLRNFRRRLAIAPVFVDDRA